MPRRCHARTDYVPRRIIGEHSGRRTTEKLQRMAMAGKELLHSLAEGELDIHHAAVANRGKKSLQTRHLRRLVFRVILGQNDHYPEGKKSRTPKGKKDQERR